MQKASAFGLFTIVAISLFTLLYFFDSPVVLHTSVSHADTPALRVSGNKIIDPQGHQVLLQGGMIDMFDKDIPNMQWNNFSQTVLEMTQAWHMNVIRFPTCAWRWQADPTNYLANIKQAVQIASNAGMYVIVDSHDDNQCNPSYPAKTEPYHLPRPGMDIYIQTLGTTLSQYPNVIFDLYNEPAILSRQKESYTDADWKLWLNGGAEPDGTGQTINYLGEQTLINDFRKIDTSHMIMIEGYAHAETYENIGNNLPIDPANNIVYEVHNYSMTPEFNPNHDDPKTYWDRNFGFMATNHAMFVGEWALMGGGNSGQTNCNNISSASQADSVTTRFLQYMASYGWGWTGYAFDPEHMIDPNNNSTVAKMNYSPTTFDFSWTCGTQTAPIPGMGTVILTYLLSQGTPTPTPTPTTTSTPTPTQSGTPTITPTPSGTPTVTHTPSITPSTTTSTTPTDTTQQTQTPTVSVTNTSPSITPTDQTTQLQLVNSSNMPIANATVSVQKQDGSTITVTSDMNGNVIVPTNALVKQIDVNGKTIALNQATGTAGSYKYVLNPKSGKLIQVVGYTHNVNLPLEIGGVILIASCITLIFYKRNQLKFLYLKLLNSYKQK